MSKQQTAVEWLEKELKDRYFLINSEPLFETAKQIEKEQIIDAYWGGLNGSINDYSESKQVGSEIININYGKGAEQYYNKTYI